MNSHSALRTSHPASRRAQALVELAVFGAIMLMMLGTLLNWGLRNEFQQSEQMDAFRDALAATAEQVGDKHLKNTMPTFQGRGSVTLINDRHIPDPSDTFGVGSVSPVSGSADVVRDHSLHFTADLPEDLPRVRYLIQGKEYNCNDKAKLKGCSTAGFWDIPSPGPGILPVAGIIRDKDTNKCINDPDEVTELDKLVEIFGESSVQVLPDKDTKDSDVWKKPPNCNAIVDEKVPFGRKRSGNPTPLSPEEQRKKYLDDYRGYVRVIDPCQGDIISYEACRRIARQLSSNSVTPSGENFCVAECKRGRLGGSVHENECQEICNQTLRVLPWYAQGVSGNSVPELDRIFGKTAVPGTKTKLIKNFGIQPGSRRSTVANNVFVQPWGGGERTAPPPGPAQDNLSAGFKTESAVDVTNTTDRTMMHVDYPVGGAPAQASNTWKSQHVLKQDKMFSWEDQ